ncbi:BON domain-containing protein [Arsukibacterium sp. UBA3155]|uniref:BON domain-containing protein n=1 Tax=Arsukibacterium sp. UBA3155 TaxID=1946058 RepID=UPI0025BAA8CE|nr:BON domain-containing protein [Arsukibacterium sp. UBA3155]|tara:strand:- start:59212 stop:59742 length:531 start_codon:yes stop_codon:yes gene_type:complete
MNISKLIVLAVTITLLQGCVVSDRRTLGSQIDDNSIVIRARRAIGTAEMIPDSSNIGVTSYNGIVLLTGQVNSNSIKQQAELLVKDTPGVRDIHNQIRLGNSTSLSTRTRDSWITTKVKSQLLTDDDVSGLNITVVTENAEVFLMGLVSGAEADKAVDIARNVEGVARVVKAFERR